MVQNSNSSLDYSNQSFLEKGAAELRTNKDRVLLDQLNDQQLQGNLIGILLMFLMGIKPNENGQVDANFTNEETTTKFSNALGIEPEYFKNIVEDVQSGNQSTIAAAISLFTATTPARADVAAADQALGDYHNLTNLPPVDDANFLDAVNVVLKLEGGWNPNEPDGAVAMFGINSNANPDIDVRNLGQSEAVHIYKERYWDKIDNIENLDQRSALIAFDLAVNSGVGRANQFLKELEQEGKANLKTGEVDNIAFMQKREGFYDELVQNNPAKFSQYEKGWDTRLQHLSAAVEKIPEKATEILANNNQQLSHSFAAQAGVNPYIAAMAEANGTIEVANTGVSQNDYLGLLNETQDGSSLTEALLAESAMDMGTTMPVGYGVLLPEYSEGLVNNGEEQTLASTMPVSSASSAI